VLALGGPAMADHGVEEAQADRQGSDGGPHPTRRAGRRRLTAARTSFRGLTHLSPAGEARMVDVSAKRETAREAVAHAVLRMTRATLRTIRLGNAPKGDVLGVART